MSCNPFDNYKDYMESDIWKLKRNTMIKQNPNCKICKKTKNIVVHHLNYKMLGNESEKDLIVVCWDCHNKIHQNKLIGIHEYYNFENTKDDWAW